jgi:hypothetical protein
MAVLVICLLRQGAYLEFHEACVPEYEKDDFPLLAIFVLPKR